MSQRQQQSLFISHRMIFILCMKPALELVRLYCDIKSHTPVDYLHDVVVIECVFFSHIVTNVQTMAGN
jgi:hypothetical protein